MTKPLPWMLIYPSVADVAKASNETCFAWHEHLPKPQTDVERTVRRRLSARMYDWMKEEAPEFADTINDLYARIGKIIGFDLRDAVDRGDFR
jgi:hypothetical protein